MKRVWRWPVALGLGLSLVGIRVGNASVGIEDRQGKTIATRDLQFMDEDGKSVVLDQYFHLQRPVILVPMYFGCPGPCTVLLDELVTTLKNINASAGRGYEVVLMSIDPNEKPSLAKAKKQYYLKLYARPETRLGWHFLTGSESEIQRAADQLGFDFERDRRTGRITHASAVYVLTPEGRISRTFAALHFSRRLMFVSLYEAGRGRIQALLDHVAAICRPFSLHSWPHSWRMTTGSILAGVATLGIFLI